MRLLTAAPLLLFAIATVDPAAVPEEADAVVNLGGCSGVCISPAGHILSAEHCGRASVADFEHHGRHDLEVVYDPPENRRDQAALYHVQGGTEGFPYVLVADEPPKVGDPVWSIGYPSEGRNRAQWEMHRGRVTQVGLGGFTTDGIACDFKIDGGNSGGPLFNERGELVGLASTSDRRSSSVWIGLESIRQTIASAGIRIGPPIELELGDRAPVPKPEPPQPQYDVPLFPPYYLQPQPDPQPVPQLAPGPSPDPNIQQPLAVNLNWQQLLTIIAGVAGSVLGIPALPGIVQALLRLFGKRIASTKEKV